MKLLIIYGTTEGHTRKICGFLRDETEHSGHETSLADATATPPDPDRFDSVVIAGSLHAGRYQNAVIDYVKKHHNSLNSMKSVFVSVSLTAAANEPESWKELKNQTNKFLAETEWEPVFVEQVAGALLYTQYDFLKRFIMRLISKRAGGDSDTTRNYEYTDWDQVKEIVKKMEQEEET